MPALSRTNSFLLAPEQINAPLTSTQPDEQPRAAARRTHKHYESETPRGLSHVTRPRSAHTDAVCSLQTEPRPGRKSPGLLLLVILPFIGFMNFGSGAEYVTSHPEPARPARVSFVNGGFLLSLLFLP